MSDSHSTRRPLILMLDSTGSWRGGQTQVWLLSRGLVERGYRVTVATRKSSILAEKAGTMGIEVFPVSISSDLDIASVYKLRRYLKRQNVHAIHAHTSHAHGCAFLATLFFKTKPLLFVSRRVAFTPGKGFFSRCKYRHGADVYLAISEAVRATLVESGVPDERIRVIPSAVDLSLCRRSFDVREIRSEFSLDEGEVVIGTVGALTANKAQDDFLKATRMITERIPEARFIIVGEGGKRGELEELARKLGVTDKVLFTGFKEDAARIMSIFDCFVMPSILEGLCTSVMTAQAMGIPVVATETGGIPELVQDGRDGLLVPPRRPARIAEAVLEMISNAELRRRCVENARKRAERYDSSIMVEKTARLYEELFRGRGVHCPVD